MDREAKWYVVHTYSGYENKVADNIMKVVDNRNMHDLIMEVQIPTETVEEIGENGKKKVVERKLYPCYVMVKIAVEYDNDKHSYIVSDEAWLVIRNTRGATGFVGPEGKPVPLTDEEVIAMGVEKRTVEVKYAVGDFVTIIDPLFEGFTGKVKSIDLENEQVKVTVSALFGKETDVDLALDQVEPFDD